MLLKDIAILSNRKIETELLNAENYISTENMLPNFQGIVTATSVPKGKAVSYINDDILLSNIRPYFKKIWYANRNGGCSNDVIVIRTISSSVLSRYLYCRLTTQSFIDYYVASSNGVKMPRGSKQALEEYDFNLHSLPEQQHIVNTMWLLVFAA